MDKATDTISGLRFQVYDNGEVHIHDDANKTKFIAQKKDFREDVKAFMKQKEDGLLIVLGTGKPYLYLIRDSGKVRAMVVDPASDVKKDLEKFISKL